MKKKDSTDLLDLGLRYQEEKNMPAEYNTKIYSLSYIWWLEYKVLDLEKQIRELKNNMNKGAIR